MVTKSEILRFAPAAKPALVDAIVQGWPLAEKAGIDKNTKRLHGFMASIAVESGGLTKVEESLNYLTTRRLRAIFGKYLKTDAQAAGYVRQPKKLAILVYGGRLGNAKSPSTDGWDYRGGGLMQTTGRSNYRDVGFEDNPADLRIPSIAFETAVKEWVKRKCNAIADSGDTKALRKSINGGLNGYAEFVDWTVRAGKVWPKVAKSGPVAADPPNGLFTPPPVDDPTPEPDVEQSSITTAATVLEAQTRLRELGYSEVGTPDGKIGKMTTTAILAFRNEHDLPLTPTIDEQFLAELAQAKPREMLAARADATPAEVREQVPEVQGNFFSKIGAWILGIPAAIGSVISGAFEAIPGARETLAPIKEIAMDVPGWMWFVAVGGVALAIYLVARRGEKKGVEAFQEGARR